MIIQDLKEPYKIRRDIKKGIKKGKKIKEIPNRAKAISEAIKNLKTGQILLVAGKGHETVQDFGKHKNFFSDKKIILNSIKSKNLNLSNNLKVNIINELSSNKKLPSIISFKKARINSKEVKKNDIFFAIKGKNNDGNKFVEQSFKKKASAVIVNKIQNKFIKKIKSRLMIH